MALSQKKLAQKRARKNQARKGKTHNPRKYFTVKNNRIVEPEHNPVTDTITL